MYKIAIFLRRKKLPNVFRQLILNALEQNFNEYIICSAFFQEPYINPKTNRKIGQFSTSTDIISSLNQNHDTSKAINLYGLYNTSPSHVWHQQFNITCRNLHQYSLNSNISFKAFKFKHKSHSKIFIAKHIGIPCLAIIGSSNLSSGAFSLNKNWNQETDVILWNTQCKIANNIIQTIFNEIIEDNTNLNNDFPIQNSIIITNYDEEHILNTIPLQDKLINLESSIINESNLYNDYID